MNNYLLILTWLPISCIAMDTPSAPSQSTPSLKESAGKLCTYLAGRGKFSPDGKKIFIATETKDDWRTITGDLHIKDISTEQITHLEKSETSALDKRKADCNEYCKHSWSPNGTLLKAEYFPAMDQIVLRHYDSLCQKEAEVKLPPKVLKVWNPQGKLLYQHHHSWGNKLYFTANDEYLLVKEREKPLIVYDAATGKQLLELGQPSNWELRMPADPQNKVLVLLTPDMSGTTFYDHKSFLPLASIAAAIKKFSADGSLMLADQIEKYDEPNDQTCCSSNGKYLAYFCAVYNRHLQKIACFNIGWMHRFDISTDRKTVTSFNHEQENNFDLASGKLVHSFSRSFRRQQCEFLSTDGTQIIALNPDEEKNTTHITISQKDQRNVEFTVAHVLNEICYTRIPEVIVLVDYSQMHYLLNTKTNTLTDINLTRAKTLFNHNPVSYVTQDGHFITNTDSGYELRKLEPVS